MSLKQPECSLCGQECGFTNQPGIYVFNESGLCKEHFEAARLAEIRKGRELFTDHRITD